MRFQDFLNEEIDTTIKNHSNKELRDKQKYHQDSYNDYVKSGNKAMANQHKDNLNIVNKEIERRKNKLVNKNTEKSNR